MDNAAYAISPTLNHVFDSLKPTTFLEICGSSASFTVFNMEKLKETNCYLYDVDPYNCKVYNQNNIDTVVEYLTKHNLNVTLKVGPEVGRVENFYIDLAIKRQCRENEVFENNPSILILDSYNLANLRCFFSETLKVFPNGLPDNVVVLINSSHRNPLAVKQKVTEIFKGQEVLLGEVEYTARCKNRVRRILSVYQKRKSTPWKFSEVEWI